MQIVLFLQLLLQDFSFSALKKKSFFFENEILTIVDQLMNMALTGLCKLSVSRHASEFVPNTHNSNNQYYHK